MKWHVCILVALVCCGNDPAEDCLIFQEQPRCLSCNQAVSNEIEIPDPQPRVFLFPSELLFYFSADTATPYSPQYVTVTNKSMGSVSIISANIVPDQDCWICGESIYFTLVGADLPHTLKDNESMALKIFFTPSTVQQGAILKVRTTFEPNAILDTTLSGKVFVW